MKTCRVVDCQAPVHKDGVSYCTEHKTWVSRLSAEDYKEYRHKNYLRNRHRYLTYANARRAELRFKSEYNAYMLEYKSRPDKHIKRSVARLKVEAKRKGIAFDADYMKTLELAPPLTCICCGITLDYKMGRSMGKGALPDAPSIDKVIPELGYVPGNVNIICWRCNRLKNNGTATELRAVADYIDGHLNTRAANAGN
jgi:hypothetical protein